MVFSIKTACISETVNDKAKVTIATHTSFLLVPRSMTLNDI